MLADFTGRTRSWLMVEPASAQRARTSFRGRPGAGPMAAVRGWAFPSRHCSGFTSSIRASCSSRPSGGCAPNEVGRRTASPQVATCICPATAARTTPGDAGRQPASVNSPAWTRRGRSSRRRSCASCGMCLRSTRVGTCIPRQAADSRLHGDCGGRGRAPAFFENRMQREVLQLTRGYDERQRTNMARCHAAVDQGALVHLRTQ